MIELGRDYDVHTVHKMCCIRADIFGK